MFIPALERLSTPEQAAKWVPQAYRLHMLGTYCQTELGHGMLCAYTFLLIFVEKNIILR